MSQDRPPYPERRERRAQLGPGRVPARRGSLDFEIGAFGAKEGSASREIAQRIARTGVPRERQRPGGPAERQHERDSIPPVVLGAEGGHVAVADPDRFSGTKLADAKLEREVVF